MKFFSLLSCCALIYSASCVNVEDLKLDLVQVIFRHGARTPSIEESSLINVTDPKVYAPYGFFQLTNLGKNQAYELGKQLDARYGNFLGGYRPKEMYALSTDYARTKMTMQLVLAGLFKPSPSSSQNQWNPQLNWNPISFHYTTDKIDVLLAPHSSSKYLEVHAVESRDVVKKLISNYSDFFELIKEKTGKNYDVNLLYLTGWTDNIIQIHKMLNLSLPDWATNEVSETLHKLFKIGLEYMSVTPKLKRLNGGTLVRRLIENIDSNRNENTPKKIYLYSTHDLTLAGFLLANGIELSTCPEFGAAVIVETYKDVKDNYYLKMHYWNGESFRDLKMENCDVLCPFTKYQDNLKDVIPSDDELKFLASG